ncbi:MAG: Lrp/AsnC family transcriptional regulator [Pseudomonadota bacterium]
MDALDKRILAALQRDSTTPLEELARQVNSSKTPVWNRIRKMRESGVIKANVSLIDPESVGLGVCFFMLVRTNAHEQNWLKSFQDAVARHPEILEAHRLAGDVDYILKVRVASPSGFDAFYRRLISEVAIYNVTSLLSMEEMKNETALPIELGATKRKGRGAEDDAEK